MGASLMDPSVDQQDSGKPSIATVVGFVDPSDSLHYWYKIKAQNPKQKYIENLEGMVHCLLVEFKKECGSKPPNRLIFYRNGEGESEKVIFI
jgi:hypothetical protein